MAVQTISWYNSRYIMLRICVSSDKLWLSICGYLYRTMVHINNGSPRKCSRCYFTFVLSGKNNRICVMTFRKHIQYVAKSIATCKKNPYIINKNHIFQKIIAKSLWIDFNKFYTKVLQHVKISLYIPRLFSEYMLTFRVEEPMKICVTN